MHVPKVVDTCVRYGRLPLESVVDLGNVASLERASKRVREDALRDEILTEHS